MTEGVDHMEPNSTVAGFAARVVAAGCFVGSLIAAAVYSLAELGLASGPSFVLFPLVAIIGGVVGLIVGLCAAVGATLGILSTRGREKLSAWRRAIIIGGMAATTASVGAVLLLNHPFVINGGYATAATVLVALIGVTVAARVCGRPAHVGA
jgi:hypothetical protein